MGRSFFMDLPYWIAALVPALTFHEYAHALIAHFFGDETAKQSGRLSLNPLVHLDPLGTLAIFLIGFGWGKPVPIEPSRFRSSWGAFFVALAGPMMNFLLAFVFAILFRMGAFTLLGPSDENILIKFFQISIQLNLALAFFNLIPIGPLDGNHVVERLLPTRASVRFSEWNLHYGSTILFAIILLDMFTPLHIFTLLIGVPTAITTNLLMR